MAAALLEEDVVIVGAGIAGIATSLALHRVGIRSMVLESASSLRMTGFSLGVWTNAWKALDALGVGDVLRQQHLLLDGVVAASTITGQTNAETSFLGSRHEVRCVQRKLLLESMEKELPIGTIRYSSKVVSVLESGCFKLVHLVDGTVIKTKVLIGCDGVNSMVAKSLGLNETVTSRRSEIRGSAIFPQSHGFASKQFMFAGNGFRAGCMPCDDTTIYWFFSWSPSIQEKDIQDNPAKMKEHVLAKLHNAPNLKNVIETTSLDSILLSPLRYRHPWELLLKKLTKNSICVAGDALHSMMPDLGQGGCAALEDSVTLARCLATSVKTMSCGSWNEEEWRRRVESGLNEYVKERRWRSLKLIAVAYLAGGLQTSDGMIMTFVRDHLLGKFLAGLSLRMAEFDCGKLTGK